MQNESHCKIGSGRKLKTVNSTKKNAYGFLIDICGNALENFFKKFSVQFKYPFHTGVYAVSANAVDEMATFFDKIMKIDHNDKILVSYRVTPEGKMQEQAQSKYQSLEWTSSNGKKTTN